MRLILRRNLNTFPRVEPSTPLALAEQIGEPNPKVYRALANGKPKLDIAVKISKAIGESLDFLADPTQSLDRSEGDRFASWAATLTPAERDALAELIQGRGLRQLLSAHRAATQGGRAAPSAMPT